MDSALLKDPLPVFLGTPIKATEAGFMNFCTAFPFFCGLFNGREADGEPFT
jgi:hypothetical protein